MFLHRCLTRSLFFTLFTVLTPLVLSAVQTQPLPGRWTDALTVAPLPDGSLLVAQSSGMIDRLIPDGNGFHDPLPWADLGGEGVKLVGFTVDPGYLSSGYLYAALLVSDKERTILRITRWRHVEGSVVLNRILVDDLPSGAERSGGVLKVGPDGKLWVGLGDGGAAADEVTASSLRGVLLRYNDDGTVPEDNPTPGSPVWAKGLRDPSGLAWNPASEKLYALDRGPGIPRGTMDEVNLMEKGADYGWPKHLGREVVKGVVKPVIYCSSGHSWIPGGAVFLTTGEEKGSLLFAGAGEGILYRLSLDTKSPTKILFYEELVGGALGPLADVALGTDEQPYLLSKDRLYRLVF